MRRLYPASEGPLSNIPSTGCSPTLMRVGDWMKVTPRWEAITAQARRPPPLSPAASWLRVLGCTGAVVLYLCLPLCLVCP